MSFSSQHHSFDIKLAAMYGVEEAILIHHFQHWIRINKSKGKNLREGRTWMYQTRKDIQAHFPYLNVDRVKYLTEKLVEFGVLVTANYNKSAIDKTLWYAFVNESEFVVDIDVSNNTYERQKCPSRGKSAHREGKSASPIPDTITDTKAKIKEEGEKPSAIASSLTNLFFSLLKERRQGLLVKNLNSHELEMERMLNIDDRPPEEVESLIRWMQDKRYFNTFTSIRNFRAKYDDMALQMGSKPIESDQVMTNKNYFFSEKAKFGKYYRDAFIHGNVIKNKNLDKHLELDMNEVEFKELLPKLGIG